MHSYETRRKVGSNHDERGGDTLSDKGANGVALMEGAPIFCFAFERCLLI